MSIFVSTKAVAALPCSTLAWAGVFRRQVMGPGDKASSRILMSVDPAEQGGFPGAHVAV
ncbi:hypothetical protein HMPREF9344_00274 [Cutibacterium acnes HL097PA1]|nr:hypothetical protein HMPREF9344_00274 [Cutibacterium acnes HL097PA1]